MESNKAQFRKSAEIYQLMVAKYGKRIINSVPIASSAFKMSLEITIIIN